MELLFPELMEDMNAATLKLWSAEVKRQKIEPVDGDVFYPNGWYEEYLVHGVKFHLGGTLGKSNGKVQWGCVIRKMDWSHLPS